MIPDSKIQVSALTRSYSGITRIINSPISVQNTQTGVVEKTLGIWDTGATGSAITKELAHKLNLLPISQTRVNGVHGIKEGINVYAVKITLNNENVSFVLPVTECEQLTNDGSAKFLIGMDVITRGDFVISNFKGQTVMTFRVPSIQQFDFVAGIKSHTPTVSDRLPGRNDPCPCGSGKKFKHCHGKK